MKRWILIGLLTVAGCSSRPSLYVNFNMDCERIAAECQCGGPKSWESSERSIRGFCETLLAADIPPTLFVVPETGQEHAALFRQLAFRGVELGMHLHPQCWQDHQYEKYLGDYGADTQRQLLADARRMLVDALGVTPRAFRPGNFSASNDTFRVLVELGFTHGSVSDPGRYVPELHADWKEACTNAHWANRHDRLVPGNLPFLEVPLTTDPDRRRPNGFPYELRIESGHFEEWHLPIINKALRRMAEDDAPFRVLCIFTHNYWDYGDPDVPQTRTLHAYLEHLKLLAEEYDVIPATLATIRDRYARIRPPSS